MPGICFTEHRNPGWHDHLRSCRAPCSAFVEFALKRKKKGRGDGESLSHLGLAGATLIRHIDIFKGLCSLYMANNLIFFIMRSLRWFFVSLSRRPGSLQLWCHATFSADLG
ncbi:hypothetical protein [Sphingobium fuliginis]|jgi:hypothetical protein|uniref:hypothetical protein n=1 Tax=Sphingobium fuliginis (strain ATCC 27551) TaxID=336203 RepID=UPI001C3F9194|nr:hypothetical protein [Sphingobium fuliginis]